MREPMSKEMTDLIATHLAKAFVERVIPQMLGAVRAAVAEAMPSAPAPAPIGPDAETVTTVPRARGAHLSPPFPAGSKHPSAKLNEEQVREIRRLKAEGFSTGEIARAYSISDANVYLITSRRGWKHVTD